MNPADRAMQSCRFNLQNKDMRFGSFVFGPVVMRLLHSFRQPDLALSLVRDPVSHVITPFQ